MSYTVPTIAQFKTRFARDFAFGTTQDVVMDVDITNAILDAGTNINESIFKDEAEYQLAYLYLAAHHLVVNLKAAMNGINGSFSWLVNSNTVGPVSTQYDIPEWVKNDKFLGYITTTEYGAKYCSIVAPRLIGNFQSFYRYSLP